MPPAHSRGGQRLEQLGVAEHGRRLPERADVVLGGDVDRGLAADRRVDLADQRRGHGEPRQAAPERRRGEPADVGDGAAADADDHVGALELRARRARARAARARRATSPSSPPSIAITRARARQRERRRRRSRRRPRRVRAARARRASRPAGRARRRRSRRTPRPRTIASAAAVYCSARRAPSCSNVARSPASGRAPGAPSDALPGDRERDVQPGAERALAHQRPRRVRHQRAAAERDHRRVVAQQELARHRLLERAERGLAVALAQSARTEQPARRSTLGVGVGERPSETLREQPPDRALAGAHEAGDGDRARVRV